MNIRVNYLICVLGKYHYAYLFLKFLYLLPNINFLSILFIKNIKNIKTQQYYLKFYEELIRLVINFYFSQYLSGYKHLITCRYISSKISLII
jgi:hypothetical protein